MRKRIIYEWKKSFRSPAIWILTAVLLAVNLLLITQIYRNQQLSEWENAYDSFYETYSGEITEENSSELFALYAELERVTASGEATVGEDPDSFTYNKYSDLSFLKVNFVDEMKYDMSYSDYADGIVRQAIRNVSFFEEKENAYEVNKNKKIAVAFYGRSVSEFYNTQGYNYYFNYDFSSLLVFLLIVLGVSSVFVREQETQMYYLLITSGKGGVPTMAAKLIASWMFAVLIALLFYLEDFICHMLLFGGFEAGASPLYALSSFEGTPLTLSIFAASVLFLGIRLLGILVITTFLLFVSSRMRQALWTVLVNLLAVILLGLLAARVYTNARLFLPVMLIRCRSLFYTMDYVRIMDYPVPEWVVSLAGNGLLFMALTAAILFTRGKGKRNVLV